ncbi:MAG: hypothetical protein N2234_04185 [Planctomycetota bacterium]|nr:hypothetical protein [Planctomycetota bacterium]
MVSVRMIVVLSLCFLSALFVVAQEDSGGLSDEEFRELIIRLIKQIAEDEANRPPILDYSTSSRDVIKHYCAMLETTKITVNFKDVPFSECTDFIRDVTGMNLFLSKDAREALEGVKVNLSVRDLSLKNVLNLLITVDERITYGIKYDVLYIGTKEELVSESLYIGFYFIGDIIYRPPDFKAPDIALPTGAPEPQR